MLSGETGSRGGTSHLLGGLIPGLGMCRSIKRILNFSSVVDEPVTQRRKKLIDNVTKHY